MLFAAAHESQSGTDRPFSLPLRLASGIWGAPDAREGSLEWPINGRILTQSLPKVPNLAVARPADRVLQAIIAPEEFTRDREHWRTKKAQLLAEGTHCGSGNSRSTAGRTG